MRPQLDSRQTQECPFGGSFYRCAAQNYVGCCLVEACTYGCPVDEERPLGSTFSTSIPSSTLATIASFNTEGQTVYITTTAEPSTSTTAQPSAEVPTDVSPDIQQSRSNGTPVGPIVGGVVGGVVFLVAIAFLLLLLRRKKRAKQQRRATLPPPPYTDGGDMSEQLGTTSTIHSDTKAAADTTPESVPQLDGTAVIPSLEANVDALGNIPELPAISRRNSDPFVTPESSVESESPQTAVTKPKKPRSDPENHVMSWSHFTSMGNRDPSSRRSQPHIAPESSTTVWENMNPTKSN